MFGVNISYYILYNVKIGQVLLNLFRQQYEYNKIGGRQTQTPYEMDLLEVKTQIKVNPKN